MPTAGPLLVVRLSLPLRSAMHPFTETCRPVVQRCTYISWSMRTSRGVFGCPLTSVRSSMFAGFMSTMLKDWLLCSMCHRFTLRSSLEMKLSPSLLMDTLLMW